MAFDRTGTSIEGSTLLSSLKSRDFDITVRVLLIEQKLSLSEIIRMTASDALSGTYHILPSRSSLGTEVNVVADGFSSIPEGRDDYPRGYTVLLLATPDGGSEVCLMGASCDEVIIADSRLHLLINLEETAGIFKSSVDFDSYVPQGIIKDMFSSMNSSLGQYVTVSTNQTVTGEKTFLGGTNVSSVLDADNVYLQVYTGGDKDSLSPSSLIQFVDMHRFTVGDIYFESSRNGANQYLTSSIGRYDSNYELVSGVVDQKMVSNHYNVLVDDSCVFFEDSGSNKPVGAWHEAARDLSDFYASSSELDRRRLATYDVTEDYAERIRMRKVLYQESVAGTTAGTIKTYIDLYAQNITNVSDMVKFQYTEIEDYTLKLWNAQLGDVKDTLITGPVPHDLLTISKDGGVYSTHFRGGYEVENTSYSFGSAGSLTFETSITVNADNVHIPTSYAVKGYVDSCVSESVSTYIDGQGFATISQIPTKISDLTNDAGYITESDIPSIPYKTSDLINDSGYITSDYLPTQVSDLTNDLGFVTASSLPTKLSDLNNDVGYITSADIPSLNTVNDASLIIQKNGTTVQTFTANSSTDKIADITVPTVMEDLSDSSSYTLHRGQEFVEGVYDDTDGFWVQSSQDSLYNGMCLNIYVPVRVCSDHITVKIGSTNYRHPIYYRGYGSSHAPVIHAGSMLSITFHNTDSDHIGWYSDSYDIAHWKQHSEDFSKNFVGRSLPTESNFNQILKNTYGVYSGLNFLMMDSKGNWYPFLARDSSESSAPPISWKSFDAMQIVWNAASGYSYDGTGVFFSSHPKAGIKHLMHYITNSRPCDLVLYDSDNNLYSDFDLYMRSCDSSRATDVRAIVTSILNGHVSSGGTLSGTVEDCVDSIMNSVSQSMFPIFICSKYREGAWEAIRTGMYDINACNGDTSSEDKFAEFIQYKEGAPVWLNLKRNSSGGLYPLNLSFYPCFYSDNGDFYSYTTDACVLVGFMNGVDNLNFVQPHHVYYNYGDEKEVSLRPYHVGEKIVGADIQGSFTGNVYFPSCTCSTEKGTNSKTSSDLYGFDRSPMEFYDGDLILVTFSSGNTSSSPTLNIKGTGPVAIRTSPATYLGNVSEGTTLLLRYDTTYNPNNPSGLRYKTWYVMNSDSASTLYTPRTVDGVSFNGSANVSHYCTCSTDSSTVEKTATVTGFVLETGARVTVKFSNSNTAKNPTLNVYNGSAYTGAKEIKYRGTSSVSDSSNYYRWQAGDVIDLVYDGTYWVMVGWQTYAYYASSASSASTATSSTYANYLRYSTTNLLTAADTSTVTSAATIRPSSNGGSSLGTTGYKWNYVYANYIGTSSYPVSTAHITDMHGTASRATSDASGNTITSTYLKSVTLVNSSGTDLTNSGTVGVQESGTYVVPSKWPVLLRLTKGSGANTDIGLRSLLCSYMMGIPRTNTSTSSSSALDVNGAEGCIAILQVYRTSNSSTISRGSLVSSYSTVSVRGISSSGASGSLEWTSNSETVSGTWVAINHTTTSAGSYNYCMVLAVRIW